jgi:CRP/FNR family transcriptional regulator, cyclic AMP receptor protein
VNAARLKSIPVFAGLTKRELRRVADCADEIDVPEGEHLLHEGRFAFEFFAIRKGAVEVMRDGSCVAELGPGDVMGEIGALSHGQRNASVIAKAPTTVIFLRAQDFRHLAEELPALGEQIRRVVEERTRSIAVPDV